jgi:hypothetical protein
MNHVCIYDAGVMRSKGAGCLTCESEYAGAGASTGVIPETVRSAVIRNP